MNASEKYSPPLIHSNEEVFLDMLFGSDHSTADLMLTPDKSFIPSFHMGPGSKTLSFPNSGRLPDSVPGRGNSLDPARMTGRDKLRNVTQPTFLSLALS